MKIIGDCRVPEGMMLSPEFMEEFGSSHECSDEDPCEQRREELREEGAT